MFSRLSWVAWLWAGGIGLSISVLGHANQWGWLAEWKMKNEHAEELRELCGLVLVLLWMIAIAARGFRVRHASVTST